MKKYYLTLVITVTTILTASAQWGEKISWKLQNDTLIIISGVPETLIDYKKYEVRFDNRILHKWGFETFDDIWEPKKANHVVINEGVKEIGEGGFGNFFLKTVRIPNSVTHIGKGAFFDCEFLESIEIPSSIEKIEEFTFFNCIKLKEITIPSNIKSIADNAFYLNALETINVEIENKNYCSIDGVLYNKNVTELVLCPNKKQGSVKIPESVTKIGNYAIYNCVMTDLYVLWENPPVANDNIFGDSKSKCKIETLHIPIGTKKIYQQAGWTKYFKKIVERK